MRYFYYSEIAAKLNGAHALMVGGGDEQCLFTEQNTTNKPSSKYEDIKMVYSCEDGNEPSIRYNVIEGKYIAKHKRMENGMLLDFYELNPNYIEGN